MKLCIIIPAAGASSRYREQGGVRSKLDEDLGGRPVLQRTVELFVKREDVHAIVVAGPLDGYDAFRERYADKLGLLGVRLCKGGQTHRWETVHAALREVPRDCTHIAVHDAARPCLPTELLDRLFEAAAHHPAVIPGLRVGDTLKEVSNDALDLAPADPADAILGGAGKSALLARPVVRTLRRTNIMLIQTPQVFERSLLERAYAQTDLDSTDDATLVERLGEQVMVIEGDARNIKLTTPADLALARAILNVQPPKEREAHLRF